VELSGALFTVQESLVDLEVLTSQMPGLITTSALAG